MQTQILEQIPVFTDIDPDLVTKIKSEFKKYGVGNTPLVPINELLGLNIDTYGSEIYVKDESKNSTLSVKARPALWMVIEAILRGDLTEDKKIIESSSGNTGISALVFGKNLGYEVELVLPKNSKKIDYIISLGGKIILAEADGTSDDAIRIAREMYNNNPEKYFYLNQYDNFANPMSHYNTTAEEIWEDSKGKVTHLVAGVGTGGTIIGTGHRLKKYNSEIKVIGVQPAEVFHGFSGLKKIDEAIHVPLIYSTFEGYIIDDTIHVGFEAFLRSPWYNESFRGGNSSVAALYASLQVAKELKENNTKGVIITIFPDGKENYLHLTHKI